MNSGKSVRLSRIFNIRSHKTVMAPLDDILLSGPEDGLRDAEAKIAQIVAGKADAIMGFYGLFAHAKHLGHTSGIMNLTASTSRSCHTHKVLVGSVEQAVAMGMDGVAVHVNISSQYESEMLVNLAAVARECGRFGMPLMALMYPRGEKADGTDENYLDVLRRDPEDYAAMVRHAVRVGVDLGADIVKTQYTGSAESFHSVVESAQGVPVIMAGGPKIANEDILENAHNAMVAGAAGVCIGRNIFNNDDTTAMVRALGGVVHHGRTVAEAMRASGLVKPTVLAHV